MLKEKEKLYSKETRMAKEYIHELEVRNIENFKAKTYQIPYKYQELIKKEIDKLLI